MEYMSASTYCKSINHQSIIFYLTKWEVTYNY